ncbi:IclR family transcriptional regulator [Subtercola sp. Z020]|uniref:IclR family transcriptional regulator n=1 Tax=Subtercola sp. Z020 TaxID=2080582 RepID=UPI000CE79A3E|nr:helix-turn-helix domain-containing protein [Subtercola sp. Z020]PPF82153.1 IclR family transcriptional regulator [Subtercola sp. Z020]
MPDRTGSAPEYAVPALDKALDVLELLADSDTGLSQAEIAAEIGRNVAQIFRVLTLLERRGYLYRDAKSGLYQLSTRLFDLAHRQEPLRSLVAAAHPPMRRLADETRSSCNLSVLDAGRMRVVAQVVSPSDFGFQVRVGALFPVETTASGLVQLAFSGAGAEVGVGGVPASDLAAIRARGHLERPDALQPGVTDIVFPVLEPARASGERNSTARASTDRAIAVLTVPYVATSFSERTSAFVARHAEVAAREIAESLLGNGR